MNTQIYKTGYRSGMAAFAATAAYVIVQLLQVAGALKFPYDEVLIYGTSLCITVPFILEMLALHYVAKPEKKFWSHAALIFSVMYALFVIPNYVVQLATVIPAKLNGTSAGLKLLEQTPHSLFWDYDAMGYICMGIASLFAVKVFEKQGFQKWVRLGFAANALVTPLISFVYFYPVYSKKLLFLGFAWGITAPLSMLLLAIFFRKKGFDASS
jgi:hypothetical protein